MGRLFRSATVLSFLFVGGLAALAAPVSAQTTGVGGRPAAPDPSNPRSASIFIYQLPAGATKQDQLLVSNDTAKPQTIDLYAVDATTTNTGSLACRQQIEPRLDVGGWVTLAQNEVTLEPGQNQIVTFTLQLPAEVSPGEHDGCLVFQQRDDQAQTTGNIRIRTRQAVRMAVTVPGDIKKALNLAVFQVQSGKAITFGVTVKNTGNVSADTDVRVKMHNLFGKTVYENGGSYPVFGGNKLDLSFRDNKKPTWGGFYIAEATIRYDKRPGVFGLNDASQLVTYTSGKKLVLIMPSPGVLIIFGILLLLVGAGLYRWYERRRQRQQLQEKWQNYTVRAPDTLEDLAHKYQVTWKLLASANRLRPPYQLHKGQQLKVPPLPSRTSKNTRKGSD